MLLCDVLYEAVWVVRRKVVSRPALWLCAVTIVKACINISYNYPVPPTIWWNARAPTCCRREVDSASAEGEVLEVEAP